MWLLAGTSCSDLRRVAAISKEHEEMGNASQQIDESPLKNCGWNNAYYVSKTAKRRAYSYFECNRRYIEIEKYMHGALQKKEFEVWYQPQYSIATHRCFAAEALVRWRSPVMGLLRPGAFLNVFEHNNFIAQLDSYMLREACAFQEKRMKSGEKLLPVFVNQSNTNVLETGYPAQVKAYLESYGLPVDAIVIELTKSVLEKIRLDESYKAAEKNIRELHDLGIKVSMDDFGAGSDSFLLLDFLPVDIVKVDRSLLKAAVSSERAELILSKIVELSGMLDISVICEGVETEEQEELLNFCGCYGGQGFLFAKPMPETFFSPWAQQNI